MEAITLVLSLFLKQQENLSATLKMLVTFHLFLIVTHSVMNLELGFSVV